MKKASTEKTEFVTLSPRLRAGDAVANYWMRQATFRLRREVCWCWQERGLQPIERTVVLPPFTDRAVAALDQSRYWEEKKTFYQADPTARYLTEHLETPPPHSARRPSRGTFGWVVDELRLDRAGTFVLALALTSSFDGSMGSVIAACLNDPSKTLPNLALAQKLWDEPDRVLSLADPAHPLFTHGLLKLGGHSGHGYAETEWEQPLVVPSLVANQLLFHNPAWPHGLSPLISPDDKENGESEELTEIEQLLALRVNAEPPQHLRLVPVLGGKGAARRETVRRIARLSKRQAVEFKGDVRMLENAHYLSALATLCWLREADLFIGQELSLPAGSDKQHAGQQLAGQLLAAASIPATIFFAIGERSQIAQIPASLLLPLINVPSLEYSARVAHWQKRLGAKAKGLEREIAEISRRFRYEKEVIDAISTELCAIRGRLTAADLTAACRAEMDLDIGELAQKITPRFDNEKLILPHKQALQFEEHLQAMRGLTEVHYSWGTAKAWNESGISVLFAGPPGTGKTMAAEILAIKLDLPMYRIDLSQVVNKYIGETEKNLKRVFDAADVSDMILFFDEADSLFGRRTEVSDAHDRYANIEISYLLERMERFKGLAILATNRKKDLDEAFLRRLRYILDFPLPDFEQRLQIWRQVVPANADSSALDFDFLARQFPLAGGNIRSIVFNACLQCADGATWRAMGKQGRLTMESMLIAVKREFDKMNRALSLEQFGPYTRIIVELEHQSSEAQRYANQN